MARSKKPPAIDGWSPVVEKKIRSAIRDVWRYTPAWRMVVKRCLIADGYSRCEQCQKKCPKVFVDHITRAGEIDGGYLKRMFVPSTKLMGLCDFCHKAKTKIERLDDRW